MRAVLELRIPEDRARDALTPDEGMHLGSPPFVRKLKIALDDPRALELDALAMGWLITRTYSPQELDAAVLLHLVITSTFEPAGEECGTTYDESVACHYRETETFPVSIPGGRSVDLIEQRCGAGRKQSSDLRLDLRRVPRSKDIARTIADEWVISDRFAALLEGIRATGFEARPVFQRSQHEPSRTWHQLTITAPSVDIVPPTLAGVRPSDLDSEGTYRCPLGHVIGLNLLSELTVSRRDRPKTDFAITRQYIGVRRGLLAPAPLIVVSQRVREVIERNHIKGCRLEVAHLR